MCEQPVGFYYNKNYLGYDSVYTRTTDNESVRRAIIESMDLRYSSHLHKINWDHSSFRKKAIAQVVNRID